MFGKRAENENPVVTLTRMESTLSSLGESFVGFRQEISDVKVQQATQKAQILAIEVGWANGLENVNQSINRISTRMEERDKPKTGFWISALSGLFLCTSSLTTVAVFFVQSSIREATVPIAQRVASMEALTAGLHDLGEKVMRSTEADARSTQDRGEINRRLELIESNQSLNLAQSRERYAGLVSGFVEVETQFKNLTGMTQYLWLEVMGKQYPIIPREIPGGRLP